MTAPDAEPTHIAALIPLVGCIWNLLLAFFVYSRAPRAMQNRVYLFLGIAISMWNLGQFFNFITPADQKDAGLFWVRFVWLGVLFIPMLLFHLSMLVTQTRVGRVIPIGYGFLALLALTLPTNFFVSDARHLGAAGWYGHPQIGLHLANIPFALMFVAIVILVRKRRTLPPMHRPRLTALIVAQSMLAVLGTNDTLPLNGMDFYPGTAVLFGGKGVPVYPYGSIAAVFYGVIVAYSVLQHHLLDVQIGLSRVSAQVVRVAFLAVTTLGLLLVATLIFPRAFSATSLSIALGVFLISIVVASLAFPRLLGGGGMEKWERRILGDHFEYQDRARAFIHSMSWYGDLAGLLDAVHDVLTRHFRLNSYHLILRDEVNRSFTVFRAHPEASAEPIPELTVPSPLFHYFGLEKSEYLPLNTDHRRIAPAMLERQAQAQLSRFSAEFAFPLLSERELFGLLLIGTKQHEEPFTSTDLSLLTALVKNISLMVNQIRLKDQILRTQELDLLGRMSRGMAHDLNNLLTPIWTLLQLAQESTACGALDEELLGIALRNTKTVRAYIREALFFSENLRPDIQRGRLDLIVAQSADLARSNRRKEVEIAIAVPGEVLMDMDEVLLQRLLSNLISNAIDASQVGSTVRVELERLAKTEATRDWLRLRVIDQGEGIHSENLERVQAAYFTTKNRGDEGRGFGLGLAI